MGLVVVAFNMRHIHRFLNARGLIDLSEPSEKVGVRVRDRALRAFEMRVVDLVHGH